MDFFFHMGMWPLASFETGWLPGPFPNITFTSLTISRTSSPVRLRGLVWWSALPLKCLPFFLTGWFAGRNHRCPRYTTLRHFFKNIPFMSPKQCVHALYPLFDCPERLLRASQSLIVTNNNARRSKWSCLCSSHTRTPGLFHKSRSSSTSGLRYTSMSLPGCFGLWMSTGIIINLCFMHNQGGRL